jgi:ribonucleoside-triphosphate reductase
MPYFTLTPTFSICPNHGYMPGKVEKCDKCGAETEVYSRIVGYIRPIQQWNPGKSAEFKDRITYKMEEDNKKSPSKAKAAAVEEAEAVAPETPLAEQAALV